MSFRYIGNVPGLPTDLETSASQTLHTPLCLKRFLACTIALITATFTFLDYWQYSRVQHEDPQNWLLLTSGRGLAPAQYRIGVYYSAGLVAHLTHFQLRHIFALSDLVCVGLSLVCIFFLLTRLAAFQTATQEGKWSCVFLALLLTQFYLGWSFWFQEPETMPALAVLAFSASLCSGSIPLPRAVRALSLLLLAILGATIRIDTVVAFDAGMLAACLLSRPSRRRNAWLAAGAAASLLAALAVERFIARSLFPHALRSASLLQFLDNLHAGNGMLVLLCTLPPWILTLWLGLREWAALPVWLRGLLLGSIAHFALFFLFGSSEEVRIMLPFFFTLVPLTTVLLHRWLTEASLVA